MTERRMGEGSRSKIAYVVRLTSREPGSTDPSDSTIILGEGEGAGFIRELEWVHIKQGGDGRGSIRTASLCQDKGAGTRPMWRLGGGVVVAIIAVAVLFIHLFHCRL